MASVKHEELPMSWSVYSQAMLRRVVRRLWVAAALIGLQLLLCAVGAPTLPLDVTPALVVALLVWVFRAVWVWLPGSHQEPAPLAMVQSLNQALAADGVPERLRRALRGDLDRGLTAPAAHFYSRRLKQIREESERIEALSALRSKLTPARPDETKS